MLFTRNKSNVFAAASAMSLFGYSYYYGRNFNKLAFSNSSSLHFEYGTTLNPKYDKRWKKGEDELLATPNFLCVLDGVGGWIEVLIDSGTMTKEFIKHVADVLKESDESTKVSDIMDKAQSRVKAKGSTTVTMAHLTQDSKLKTCNLGDSGYLVLRPEGEEIIKVFRSESQQHYFNCPF